MAPATKGGMHFLARRAVVEVFAAKGGIKNGALGAPYLASGTVSQPIGKPFNGQAKGLLWLTWMSYAGPPQYFIPPEGGALNLPVRRQPITGRTLGARGQRPGGAINLHAHQGVSTFGNTASRQFFTKTQGFPDAASFIKNKKIPYPAGIQRSRIGVVSHFRRSEGGQRYGR